MINILITGINGFVGSQLARNLSRFPGMNIIGLGFDRHPKQVSMDLEVIYGDVRDRDFVRRIVSDYEIEVVFHMAAQSIVRVCAADPVSAYDINVMGTVSVLEACRTVGQGRIRSILVSTSDKSFGHATPPYDEETPLKPLYTYEVSKACQDMIARSYYHNYGLPVKVARCSNIYGPGDPSMSRLIPSAIVACLRGKPPVLHSGVADYIREFVYIDDAISAFRLISGKGLPGDAYCVGGTTHCTTYELIRRIIYNINPDIGKPEVHEKNAVFKEIEAQWMNADKLKLLGWEPKVSLEEGIRRTINYYKEIM